MGPGTIEERLLELLTRVDARASEISSSRKNWPCRKGCDHCCRNLAAPLPMTEPEFRLLKLGLERLSPEARAQVLEGVRAWTASTRPFACPLLDPSTGGCSVYAFRPAACRAYGFYVARDAGQWCHLILEFLRQDPAPESADIVWGNEAALLEDLAALGGPELPLAEWLRREALL